jgi:MraZ protein
MEGRNNGMTQFLGTHRNRLDAKGRVSVPAPFRAAMKAHADKAGDPQAGTIVLRPSHKHACVEVWPQPEFEALAAPLSGVDLFSDAHDDLATALYADAFPAEADKDGRILLPGELIAHANLTDAVVFMGAGRIFQMWEPEAAERHRAAVRARTLERGLTLPARVSARAPA